MTGMGKKRELQSPDYIEQVLNERRQDTHEARSPPPRKERN
jgi:hypothetical protein